MRKLIPKIMANIGQESKVTVGLLLALFPVIIGSWTWVSVQLATIQTDLSHYEKRISYIEARVEMLEGKVNDNENMILKISK